MSTLVRGKRCGIQQKKKLPQGLSICKFNLRAGQLIGCRVGEMGLGNGEFFFWRRARIHSVDFVCWVGELSRVIERVAGKFFFSALFFQGYTR